MNIGKTNNENRASFTVMKFTSEKQSGLVQMYFPLSLFKQ